VQYQGHGGLTCRVYSTISGLAGVPAAADLVTALRERTNDDRRS
jgi:hypothetical protein